MDYRSDRHDCVTRCHGSFPRIDDTIKMLDDHLADVYHEVGVACSGVSFFVLVHV